MSQPPALSIQHLSVNYGQGKVLDNLSLDIPSGHFAGIVGANGSGKSTLLGASLGLLPKATAPGARIRIGGEELSAARPKLGYMPQSQQIDWDFPATVFDVALMGRTCATRSWWPWPTAADKKAAERAVNNVGLSELSSRPIGALSGGQRQRALLARTVVNDPEILILDEPFQGIDAPSQKAIVAILQQLHHSGASIIMVHHNLAEVADYCDHVTLLHHGRVSASGPTSTTLTSEAIATAYNLPPSSSISY